LVIRAEDEKQLHQIIDELAKSRSSFVKEIAANLEKSLYDDGNRRNTSKARPKNKGKSPTSNKGGSRKTKDA
jgi:hypothetical protein